MNRWKPKLLRALLDTLYVARVHRLFGHLCRGVGAIFTLHHVRPVSGDAAFSPHRILDVTPEFLATTIQLARQLDYDIVSLDQVDERLRSGDFARKFVCFTLDDGYRDNLSIAAPVFERYGAPFAVYVSTGMVEATAVLWWDHLERVVLDHDEVSLKIGGDTLTLSSRTTRQKYAAFAALYWRLRGAPHETQQAAIAELLLRYALNPADHCSRNAMTWDELRTLRDFPQATIGVHTVNHHALSKLPDEAVRHEIDDSRNTIKANLGVDARHFCYPFGDRGSAGPREFALLREHGFATATTTRKGVLFEQHGKHLHALPRISLNGDYQQARYVELFLSGTPFALANGFRPLNVD